MKIHIPRFISRRWKNWLDRRIPASDSIALTQREIFIFLSRQGWLFLLVAGLILIAAFNYQNNMGMLLAFALLSLGLLSMFATFRNLRGLSLQSMNASPVFVGDYAQFTIQMQARKNDCEAIGLGLNRNIQTWSSVTQGGITLTSLAVPAVSRGVLMMPRFYLCSDYPMGWFRSWSWPKLNAQCIVYPKPIEPEFILPKHGGTGEDGQDWEQGSEDFYEHRSYRPGDSPRQIDWKVLARERGLLVRQFVTPIGGECRFRLRDLPSADIELKLSWLSFLLCEAERSGILYALELDERVMPVAQGDRHLADCLEALARY